MPTRFAAPALAVLALALASVAVPAASPAAEPCPWPQWRGPDQQDISADTGLLASWPEGGPPKLWEIDRLGNSHSSFAICGGKLYTMGGMRQGQCIVCVDPGEGKILWAAPLSTARGRPNSTPTVNEGRVYAVTSDGMLGCVDAESGKLVWRTHLQKDLGGGKTPGWKFAESPFVDGDRLLCTPGGEDALLAALDKTTGRPIWKTALPDELRDKGAHAQYATIIPAVGGGVKQYITLIARLGLVGVRAEDGRFLWNYRRVVNGTANIATSVARGDEVFCSTAYGTGAALLKLSATGAEEVYWLGKGTFQNHHGGFLRIGDHIYGGHDHNAGKPTCIEWKTGKVLWQHDQPGGKSGCLTAADGHLYFLYQDGTAALIEATPEAYRLKGTFKLPRQGGPAWSHPVVTGGRLYLRWGQKLFCFDVKAK